MSFIIPKVMSQLQSPNILAERLQAMRTELESCKLHMHDMSKDIGDVFMDLHTIFKTLESKDKKTILSKKDRDRLAKCAHEAETVQELSKHFLFNDPRELSAMFKAPKVEPKEIVETIESSPDPEAENGKWRESADGLQQQYST
ncbi:GL18600 [Drosophila persimilis]|uniref:GL18600 n=1 Tax=Drosophila persimilis TaxID=7234 RepID=B4G9R2_DROPE|nr:GL18600 [Drosophila persimilis]